MSLMVDQTEKTWQKQILGPLGFDARIFGDIVMPGNVLGPIQKCICDELEIPAVPVINVASHDTASAIAGIPLVDKDKQWAFISLGTWAIYGVETDRQYLDEEVFESGFANQGGCEGKTNFVDLFTGLWVIQQCYERWCKDADKKIGWDAVVSAAENAKSGQAFLDLDSPKFAQPNANMPQQIQQYCRDTGQTAVEGMGEIARCVFESLVLKFKICNANVKKFTGKDIELIHVVGGGSKNRLLCQWTADAIGVPVKAGPAETTSVGNLLIQLKGMGEIESLDEGRALSGRSSKTKEYIPGSSTDVWDTYLKRYQKILLDNN